MSCSKIEKHGFVLRQCFTFAKGFHFDVCP